MRVQIVARRCEVPEAIRERAEAAVKKLARYEPRIQSAELVFQEEKRSRLVEAILSTNSRSEPVVAQGEGESFRAALDSLIDRLRRILRRRRSQLRSRKARNASETLGGE
jgi:ribosomal subunit interface protein